MMVHYSVFYNVTRSGQGGRTSDSQKPAVTVSVRSNRRTICRKSHIPQHSAVFEMTTFILPAEPLPAGTRKRGSYGSVLTHIIRASSDAEDAARLFASLLLDARPWGFARFDAHVGDTACHIRASLVREVYTVCKRHDAAGYASWLEAAAARFERIRKAAQTTCLQLTRHRVNPAILGLSAKFDTLGNIIKALLSLDSTC